MAGTCAIGTIEGCASISDKNTGQLLFYTDGSNLWNRNDIAIANGMGGNNTTTQSALIVPKPNSNSIYYIFSVAPQCGCLSGIGSGGAYYSTIDMSLNGGQAG